MFLKSKKKRNHLLNIDSPNIKPELEILKFMPNYVETDTFIKETLIPNAA